jgi:hypothetical protein
MGEINLDAARAARAEARKEGHSIRFGGKKWPLPDELPLDLGIRMMNGDVWGSLVGLLGDQWDEFYKLSPTMDDAKDLVTLLAPEYGFAEPGESPASVASSTSNGTQPRPTSNGSTRSTSAKRSGATTGKGSRSGG